MQQTKHTRMFRPPIRAPDRTGNRVTKSIAAAISALAEILDVEADRSFGCRQPRKNATDVEWQDLIEMTFTR